MVRNKFKDRHVGSSETNIEKKLKIVGVRNINELTEKIVPKGIRVKKSLSIKGVPAEGYSETEAFSKLKEMMDLNKISKCYIGQGYYPSITPAVILRNMFENPSWYTQYTPYQAEVSQGRLTSMLHFQTMICSLTGLPISNASLLDESSGAGEAMIMCYNKVNKRATKDTVKSIFLVSEDCFDQTLNVLETMAAPYGIQIVRTKTEDFIDNLTKYNDVFGMLLPLPTKNGEVIDYTDIITEAKKKEVYSIVTADLLSLCMIKSPASMGADVAVGTTQRFGVPLGFGGPHAAYMSTTKDFKRLIPGRMVGVSVDRNGNEALRLALTTREQHINKERATSNICTAQVLLANVAVSYAKYHGPEGLIDIAQRVHKMTQIFARLVSKDKRFVIHTKSYFDTLIIERVNGSSTLKHKSTIINNLSDQDILVRVINEDTFGVSFDETTTVQDIYALLKAMGINDKSVLKYTKSRKPSFPRSLRRTDKFLTEDVFNTYHSETDMMRHLHALADMDISLTRSMIPLGSCTMKLNAASEMIPLSWTTVSSIHPYASYLTKQYCTTMGYQKMLRQLSGWLGSITGLPAVSLQPNSGAQGEYTSLLAFRMYFEAKKEDRHICLIPRSAHGTNPASAKKAGFDVVYVECTEQGAIDMNDLREKIKMHKESLAAIMVTYPSTYGIYDEDISKICRRIHNAGGKVYMDGANMNAQVGLTSPGTIGADAVHLNLHKTFCIPHGGGGPGMGPICVTEELRAYLPGDSQKGTGAVAGATYGSASILTISWMYIAMMGSRGLTYATQIALLNANYMRKRLEPYFDIKYVGKHGFCAHEVIISLKCKDKKIATMEDVAKRLADYELHAPTMSFPVPNTLMIEPTESESKEWIDAYCEALISIAKEALDIEACQDQQGFDLTNTLLKNAPHPQSDLYLEEWPYPYSREVAFALHARKDGRRKYFPIARVDGAHGDRNLICTCAPVEEYEPGNA